MGRLRMLGSLVKPTNTSLVRSEPKKADPFYHSPEWRALAKEVKQERGNSCERCSKPHCYPIYADHIVELRDGGAALSKLNIQLLCASCHTTKTNEARAARHAQSHRPGHPRGPA